MVWFREVQRTAITNLLLESAVTIFQERSWPRGTPTKSFTVIVANSQLSNLQRGWFSRDEWRECWRDEAQTSSGSVKKTSRGAIYERKHHDTKEKRQAGVPSTRLFSLSLEAVDKMAAGQLEPWNFPCTLNGSFALADRSGLFWLTSGKNAAV